MSLPISGGDGPRGPSRPPSHKPLDHTRAMKLGSDLEDEAGDDPVTFELVDEMSAEQGMPHSHLYAAAVMATELEIAVEEDVVFEVCAGRCQQWGALERLDQLADLRVAREEDGKSVFDIVPRTCLDQCEHAPVVRLRSPNGTAVLTQCTAANLDEALETLDD